MQQSLTIIDDFLGNARELREAALKLDYPELEEKTYFPGRNSAKRLNIEGLDEQVGKLLGERLTPTPGTAHGKFRIALEGEEGAADIHIDESHWSGILFLNLPEQCQGGTDFFRHIPTNSDRAPITRDELHAMGMTSGQEVWEKIVHPHTNDRSKWEHTMRVPMRFNRLILLKPWLWHTASPGFGHDLATGRLVYLMFWNVAGATR